MSPAQLLDALFPEPAKYAVSRQSPSKIPGATVESTQTLLRLLRHNKEHHHIFFNDKEFHNHATHHLLAIYALGASSDLLEAAYRTHDDHQRPAFASPGEITQENYADHIGDEKWYQAYFDFFAKELLSKGVSKTVEVYVFSQEANHGGNGRKPKEMFSRFIGGLLHPLIHLGYGLEFGIPYMLTEALAQTAAASFRVAALTPPSLWDEQPRSSVVSRMSALALNGSSVGAEEVSVFNVLALVQKDASFSRDTLQVDPSGNTFHFLINSRGTDILKYADMWTLDIPEGPDAEAYLEHKIEELAFAVVLLYGVGGWKNGKTQPFQPDFQLMHTVTSSMFLPSVRAYISPFATQLLLRTYFASVISIWIARGRPPIRITEDFLSSTSPSPKEPNAITKSAKGTLTPEIVSPNPWFAIIQSVIQHPVDHMCKIQRSLMHWSTLYGTTPAGKWATGNDRLDGIELLDGTIFARVAGITADTLGWMREGQELGQWSHALFTN